MKSRVKRLTESEKRRRGRKKEGGREGAGKPDSEQEGDWEGEEARVPERMEGEKKKQGDDRDQEIVREKEGWDKWSSVLALFQDHGQSTTSYCKGRTAARMWERKDWEKNNSSEKINVNICSLTRQSNQSQFKWSVTRGLPDWLSDQMLTQINELLL